MHIRIDGNDVCWCGSGLKYKECHQETDEKIRYYKRRGFIVPKRKIIKNKSQIDGIRESGKINIAVLDYVLDNIRVGMSTEEIDQMVYNKTKELGAIPAPLDYEGFPKSVCTSINDVVCHGIPDENMILNDGDIVNIDVSTIYKGYFSDSARMVCVGNVSQENRRLVDIAKKSIDVGLSEVKPWRLMGDMGAAINKFVRSNGYSVVEDIGGHGVGIEFHEDPFVSYVSKKGTEMLMVPGMVFTIEPMINMGKPDVVLEEDDDWTIYTEDGKPSAQWEVTVAVTEDGYEILAY